MPREFLKPYAASVGTFARRRWVAASIFSGSNPMVSDENVDRAVMAAESTGIGWERRGKMRNSSRSRSSITMWREIFSVKSANSSFVGNSP